MRETLLARTLQFLAEYLWVIVIIIIVLIVCYRLYRNHPEKIQWFIDRVFYDPWED